jgi:CubicO group peptidase (beta-lactamase class C family)
VIARRPVLRGIAATVGAWCVRGFAQDASVTGTWTGVLEAGSARLRLKFEIQSDGTVALYSLDQGGQRIQARAASMTPDRVEIEVPAVRGSFRGKLVAKDRIEGMWHQGSELPLTLVRGEGGVSAPASAVEPLTQDALEALRREADLPALVAAAALRGNAGRKWVTGERVAGGGSSVTPDDQWHLGSITKSMTATLVARLVDAGAIRWDDTIGDMLKTIVPGMQDAYKTVTFRHLLCHRSGLPANIPVEQLVKFPRESENIREDRRGYARIALSMSPVGPAASTFTYSNNGYIVAAAMLETKLDRSWEELIRAHVFDPLKLASAGFGAPGRKGAIEQPVGHTFDGKSHVGLRIGDGPTDNPHVIGPAGRVHMKLDDVLTYLAAHRDAASFLKAESWRTLHTPPFGGEYAMGWVVRSDGVRWHNGSNTLWYAEVLFNKDSGVAAAAAANEAQPKTGTAVGQALLRAARAAA